MSKILIIEDDPILIESLAEFLIEEGIEVVTAQSGKQGAELAAKELPDLILCDIFMPGMNGYETFEKIKSDIATSLIPFIFLSARAEREDILYGMTIGADDYITKPVDFDELLKRITRRMEKTRETIRRSEIKYHAVFETVHDAILLLRLSDLSIIDANQAACDMLGHLREELLKTPGRKFIKDVDLTKVIEHQNMKEWNFEEFQNLETTWTKKNDEKIQIQVNGKVIVLFGEKCLFMIAQDITERKYYEKELILAKEKAEESDRLKTSILSNISHELRTPLNGILGFSELLLEDLRETDYISMVENIHLSGKRLMLTLNSIIILSQLQAGKISLKLSQVNLASILDSVCDSYETQVQEKNISLKKSIGEECIAFADLQLFQQLFHQILDNAVKFTSQGGIEIAARTVIEEQLKWQTIEIRDTGIGIKKEHLELIFEEFRQVSEGYARKYQGSGLGLTVSRKICDLMNGRITVESTPGAGSTFTIWLPASETEVATPVVPKKTRPSSEVAPEKQKKEIPHLLLVEDNMINMNLIELFLRPTYRMDYAYDGKTAVQKATETTYDAILMDINLGSGMDGIEATKRIRRIKGYENTPVIAVTGYTMIGDREKILAEGCTHYIAKPFEKATFRAIVREAIFGPGK